MRGVCFWEVFGKTPLTTDAFDFLRDLAGLIEARGIGVALALRCFAPLRASSTM